MQNVTVRNNQLQKNNLQQQPANNNREEQRDKHQFCR